MWRSKPYVLGIILTVVACDPMGNSDGISPAAGLAQRENSRIMTINPYAGDGLGANPGGSGSRAAQVIEGYHSSANQPEAATSAETIAAPGVE